MQQRATLNLSQWVSLNLHPHPVFLGFFWAQREFSSLLAFCLFLSLVLHWISCRTCFVIHLLLLLLSFHLHLHLLPLLLLCSAGPPVPQCSSLASSLFTLCSPLFTLRTLPSLPSFSLASPAKETIAIRDSQMQLAHLWIAQFKCHFLTPALPFSSHFYFSFLLSFFYFFFFFSLFSFLLSFPLRSEREQMFLPSISPSKSNSLSWASLSLSLTSLPHSEFSFNLIAP